MSVITAAGLVALGERDAERSIIRGVLRETPPTFRTPREGRTLARLTAALSNWLRRCGDTYGEVLIDAGFWLRRDPDTVLTLDLAVAWCSSGSRDDALNEWVIDTRPTLAVCVTSPNDRQGEVLEDVSECLAAGVPLMWVAEPVLRTVTVYRPGAEPELFNVGRELVGDPHLPGFRVAVASLFAR